MFKRRRDEPEYAVLSDPDAASHNRYGAAIDLTADSDQQPGVSLNINHDGSVGPNPNRNLQHGFHFSADNCIGCHACEAACSEKNDLPAHIAFRSVGYVEGGSWPDYKRVNISMACNHCDDPVCLKGCPTRAYTKHAEYGAVIQDPEICFGCGYCTWVCPYNAPQLDPLAGVVQKCNMCVDRLEVGLKPACVSACLGNALDFGVIENTPQGRHQIKTDIPGFPDPSITHPNIRFEQLKSLPGDFTRPDSQPIKYHRSAGSTSYRPEADLPSGGGAANRAWGLRRLSSRENPLVIFTLVTQAAVGAFAMLFLGAVSGNQDMQNFSQSWSSIAVLAVLLGVQGGALFLSSLHLGRPWRFYRGFNNLRHSPLSREALGVALFFAFMGVYWLVAVARKMALIDGEIARIVGGGSGGLAVFAGLAGVYFMTRIYKIKARPFWNHWQVTASFFATALSLGGVLAALGLGAGWGFERLALQGGLAVILPIMALGLALEGVGLICHRRDLVRQDGEGAAAFHVQVTQFLGAYALRNIVLGASLLAVGGMWWVTTNIIDRAGWDEGGDRGMILVAAVIIAAVIAGAVGTQAVMGRALFYVLVIPTTMPGAFFWKNKGFEDHARATGLAEREQCGVAVKAH